jgi:imidazole glycerol phosphate synthase subunit HisF
VTFPVTLTSSFSGAKNIYLYAESTSGQNSGYQTMGTWTVPGSAPAPVSVSPSSGNTTTANFQAVVSGPAGFASIASIELLFHAPDNWLNYCDLKYERAGNRFWIVNDAGTLWAGPSNLGTGTPLSNSLCSVDVTAATAVGAGNTLTVTFPVTFTGAFSGAKNIYLYVASMSGQNSGYQTMGTWTVPGPVPVPVSVAPANGNGSTVAFQAVVTDPAGFAGIGAVELLFSSAGNYCDFMYDRAGNRFWIVNDAGTLWTGPANLGSATPLSNSRCSLNVATATAIGSASTLTVTFPITFAGSFAGAKSIFLYAASMTGQNSGYQPQGTWTVP